MNRKQLDKVAKQLWPKLQGAVDYWAPEILGHEMWKKVGDPRSWVLNQLYQESETFRRCLDTGTDWPPIPGQNYPGNYSKDALDMMDLVPEKEPWQYRLCAHFCDSISPQNTTKTFKSDLLNELKVQISS